MATTILLRRTDKVAIVDDDDYERFLGHKWFLLPIGYAVRAIKSGKRDGRKIYMHREVMGFPEKQVDHRNGNKLDNRKSNLRVCTGSQNLANQGLTARNKTGFKGVCWHKPSKKWMSCIQVKRKTIYLGLFLTKVDAARAYDEAAREYFGEFAWLNFPREGERGRDGTSLIDQRG